MKRESFAPQKAPFQLYVHIPFCAHRCPYCDFAVEIKRKIPEDSYVESIIQELKLWSQDPLWASRSVSTIFFGGGTPSLFKPTSLEKIISAVKDIYPVDDYAEISMEANPGFVEGDLFVEFASAGINRVSLGAQSFVQTTLKTLGRHHSCQDITATIDSVRRAGIDNLSVDVIYGVPGQSLADMSQDISNITKHDLPHLSAYCLTIEKGTSFFRSVERGTLILPQEDLVLEMMDILEDELPRMGLSQYEISNFSKPNYQSKHNLGYWTGVDYLGLGMGAHSYCKVKSLGPDPLNSQVYAKRWANYSTLNGYQSQVKKGALPLSWSENIGDQEAIFEALYLGLRRKDGISNSDLVDSFGADTLRKVILAIESLYNQGLILLSDERFSLTKSGRRLADTVNLELRKQFERVGLL